MGRGVVVLPRTVPPLPACALWTLESHRRCSRAASSARAGTTVKNRTSRRSGCLPRLFFRDSGEHLPHAPLGRASASSCVQRALDLALPRFRPSVQRLRPPFCARLRTHPRRAVARRVRKHVATRSRWRPLPRRGILVAAADWRSPQRAPRRGQAWARLRSARPAARAASHRRQRAPTAGRWMDPCEGAPARGLRRTAHAHA